MQTFGEYGFYAGSFKRLISSSPFKVKLFIIIFANFSFGRQRCKNNPKKVNIFFIGWTYTFVSGFVLDIKSNHLMKGTI